MVLFDEVINVVQGEQELLVESWNLQFKSFNFSLKFILVEAFVKLIFFDVLQVGVENLHRLFESRNVQEIDVENSIFVDISFAQVAGYILQQAWLAEAWHTKNLDDVITVLTEEPQYVKHVLITRNKWADFIWKALNVTLNANLCKPSLDSLQPWIILLWALFSMSFVVLKQHDLVCLELSVSLLNLIFGVGVCIANILICVEYFVIEEFGKFNCCLVQYCFILVNANDMRNTSFQKDSAHLFWMTAGNIHELELGSFSWKFLSLRFDLWFLFVHLFLWISEVFCWFILSVLCSFSCSELLL